MAVRFSPAAQAEFEKIVTRYPVRRAAIMPTLWLAQREFGYLSLEVMEYVAELLELTPAFVASVASFYTMFYKQADGEEPRPGMHQPVVQPAGRGPHRRLPQSNGSASTSARPPRTASSPSSEVECLASCGTAPMMQINDDYWENLTPELTLEIIDRLARD